MKSFAILAFAGVATAIRIAKGGPNEKSDDQCSMDVETKNIFDALDKDGNGMGWNEFQVLVMMGKNGGHVTEEQAKQVNDWFNEKAINDKMGLDMAREGLSLLTNQILQIPADEECAYLLGMSDALKEGNSDACFDREAKRVFEALDMDNNGMEMHEFQQLINFGLEIGEINPDQADNMGKWFESAQKDGKVDQDGAKDGLKAMMGMLDVPDSERCMVLDSIASNVNGNNVPAMPMEECFPMAINSLVYSLDHNRSNGVSAFELEKFIEESKTEGGLTEEDADNLRAWMDEKKDANGDVGHGEVSDLARQILEGDKVPKEHWCDAIEEIAKHMKDATCLPRAIHDFFTAADLDGDRKVDKKEFESWMSFTNEKGEGIPEDVKEESINYFNDENKDGAMSKNGIRRALKHLLKKGDVPREAWCDVIEGVTKSMTKK